MVSISMCSPSVRRSIGSSAAMRWLTSVAGVQRLLAREGQQLPRQHRAALRGGAIISANWRCCGRSAPVSASSSALPSTTVSRLLKSCATPPVSWPTASSRWVGDAADHAQGLATGIAQHQAAVEHVQPATVGMLEAIACFPVVAVAVDHRLQTVADARVVVRMQHLQPPGEARFRTVVGMASELAEALVPDQGAGGEVEIPDRIGDRRGQQAQPLLALGEQTHIAFMLSGHAVEGARQASELVVMGGRDAGIEIAAGEALDATFDGVDRLAQASVDERERRRAGHAKQQRQGQETAAGLALHRAPLLLALVHQGGEAVVDHREMDAQFARHVLAQAQHARIFAPKVETPCRDGLEHGGDLAQVASGQLCLGALVCGEFAGDALRVDANLACDGRVGLEQGDVVGAQPHVFALAAQAQRLRRFGHGAACALPVAGAKYAEQDHAERSGERADQRESAQAGRGPGAHGAGFRYR
jgi:hypothetical protein